MLPGVQEKRALADRVASSSQLVGSPKLRSFFLYVVDCAIREHPEEATEQQIGVHVFGRRPGYSSGDDSIVRSQARLLRLKLASYFATNGAAESLIIDVPKGHYLPLFVLRSSNVTSTLHTQRDTLQPHLLQQDSPRPTVSPSIHATNHGPDRSMMDPGHGISPAATSPQLIAIGQPGILPAPVASLQTVRSRARAAASLVLMLLAGFAAGFWGYQHWSTSKFRLRDPLWSPFLTRPARTLVIYSNPLFRGTPAEGLHLISPEVISTLPDPEDETYTGTGEVGAIYQLTRLFDASSAGFTLKRSRLVTWDEARSGNLIFVGAPSQNSALHDLPSLTEFSIVLDQDHHGSIVNQHPRPGEPVHLPPDDKSQETAIIALLPGLEAGTRILIFSGLTTVGTQTAVEFACKPENVAKLAQYAGVQSGELRPFEAVLHIGVSKGVGVSAELVLLHRR